MWYNGGFLPEEVQPFVLYDSPMYWDRIGDFVIGERYLPDGVRQHLVNGTVGCKLVVANAWIVGNEDLVGDDNVC